MTDNVVCLSRGNDEFQVRLNGKVVKHMDSCTYQDVIDTLSDIFNTTIIFKDERRNK